VGGQTGTFLPEPHPGGEKTQLSWELMSPRRKTGAYSLPESYFDVSELDGGGRPVEAGTKRREHHQITFAYSPALNAFPHGEGDRG